MAHGFSVNTGACVADAYHDELPWWHSVVGMIAAEFVVQGDYFGYKANLAAIGHSVPGIDCQVQ